MGGDSGIKNPPIIMKKHLIYLLLVPLVVLALTPPWTAQLTCELNSLMWLYGVFFSAFLTFLFLYFKVNIFIKILLAWIYATCFISRAPYLSFTMYWSVIICAYYYFLCLKIEDFTPVKNSIQSIFFFIVLLIIMQLWGKDTLLNFNQKEVLVLGTIGNKMILGSYVCVLAPFLISISWLNWIALLIIAFVSGSSGAVLSLLVGLGFYVSKKIKKFRVYIAILFILISVIFAYKSGDFKVFKKFGRYEVWKRTVELANQRPMGWGVATYRLLFPLMSKDLDAVRADADWEYDNTSGHGLAWRRAHNCWVQILFEVGYIGFFLLIGFCGVVFWKCRKDVLKVTGLIILGTNMLVHFPTRMTQSVLIMLMFLAYCEHKGVTNGSE